MTRYLNKLAPVLIGKKKIIFHSACPCFVDIMESIFSWRYIVLGLIFGANDVTERTNDSEDTTNGNMVLNMAKLKHLDDSIRGQTCLNFYVSLLPRINDILSGRLTKLVQPALTLIVINS